MHGSVSLHLSSLGFIGLQLGYFFGQARRDYVILERNNISGWLDGCSLRCVPVVLLSLSTVYGILVQSNESFLLSMFSTCYNVVLPLLAQ